MIEVRLIDAGMPADTPVSIIENASRETEIIVETTLAKLGDTVKTTPIKGPAVLMIGYSVKAGRQNGQNISKEAAE